LAGACGSASKTAAAWAVRAASLFCQLIDFSAMAESPSEI
jgi:hypothetical protein